jgi:hypothetical protein
MALFWLALAIAVVAVVGSLVFATLRGLALFRSFKRLSRELGHSVDRIAGSAAGIERHLELAAESGSRLDASLARLRGSRARLSVLTAAIADVRASLGRITAVVPRK